MIAVVTRRLDGWSPLRASGGTEIGLQACLAITIQRNEFGKLPALFSIFKQIDHAHEKLAAATVTEMISISYE